MPKEVLLPTTADYPQSGIPFETLTRSARKAFPKDISVATTFGRASVVMHIPQEDTETWMAGLRDHANDHRYYELTHQSLGDQFEHYYLLLKDHSGRTRAIQPFLLVNQDLVTGMPAVARRLVKKIRAKFPSLFSLRMLMVGCSAGEGHLVRDVTTGGVEWVAQALREALAPVAREFGASMIVLKDFPKSYRKSLRPLRTTGFTRVPSMPGSRLDLNFKDFEDYLSTRLSHKTRKNLRLKFRKAAAAGPPLKLEVVSDIAPFIDEVFPLYKQVVEKSQYKFEELTKSYFLQVSSRMSERAVFFIWRQNGKAVAFSSCVVHDGVLRDHYIGLDYSVALDHHLYFVTFRDIITWALENKCHTYYSAPLNYEPKYHLRHDLVPLDLYVRAAADWLNPICRVIVPYLEPTRYDPVIRRFSNAHELW